MSFLDFIFPKKCLSCGKKGQYFCDLCRKTIKKNDQIALDGTSLFKYQGIIKEAVKALKYQFLTDMETEIGELMNKALEDEDLLWFLQAKPGIQPMPLFWQRENWRGFNQAKILAKIVAKKFNLPIIDSLERIRQVKPQADLSRKERLENVKNIFKVKPGELSEAILLVDDVWTTGATMNEAIKTLKKAGVKKVWGLTLAR